MKIIIVSLLFVLSFSFSTYAQNEEAIVNHSSKAIAINSQFVKSFIGLNLDSLKRLPEGSFYFEIKQAPRDSTFVFNGVKYKTYVNIVCDQYCPQLISLMDIKNRYAKDIPENYCLFMINDVLITNDLQSFLIDKEYIHTINVNHGELDQIDGEQFELDVIRIYTKTRQFLEREKDYF